MKRSKMYYLSTEPVNYPAMTVEISALNIYPVKSLKGITVRSARLTALGLANDRKWMVVRSNGKFVTQRDLPGLARIHTHLDETGVTLAANGNGSISIPFSSPAGERIKTRVWKDDCETLDQGSDISDWLTEAVESKDPLRLVRMAPDYLRPQNQPELMGEKTTTNFADLAPFLVVNENSLSALNRELHTRGFAEVPMNRFRPNIVISGIRPFAEHDLTAVSGEHFSLKFTHPCERCVVTTINQETAEKDPDGQPFKTLRDINPVPGKKPAPAFGQNAILESGEQAVISVGDRLTCS